MPYSNAHKPDFAPLLDEIGHFDQAGSHKESVWSKIYGRSAGNGAFSGKDQMMTDIGVNHTLGKHCQAIDTSVSVPALQQAQDANPYSPVVPFWRAGNISQVLSCQNLPLQGQI